MDLTELSDDCIFEIASSLPLSSVYYLLLTCRRFARLKDDDEFYRAMLNDRFYLPKDFCPASWTGMPPKKQLLCASSVLSLTGIWSRVFNFRGGLVICHADDDLVLHFEWLLKHDGGLHFCPWFRVHCGEKAGTGEIPIRVEFPTALRHLFSLNDYIIRRFGHDVASIEAFLAHDSSVLVCSGHMRTDGLFLQIQFSSEHTDPAIVTITLVREDMIAAEASEQGSSEAEDWKERMAGFWSGESIFFFFLMPDKVDTCLVDYPFNHYHVD